MFEVGNAFISSMIIPCTEQLVREIVPVPNPYIVFIIFLSHPVYQEKQLTNTAYACYMYNVITCKLAVLETSHKQLQL